MKTSIIFNYFNPTRNGGLLRTARFALESMLQTTGDECELVCADGSGVPDEALVASLRDRRLVYAPAERAESFAETYNRGASIARGDVLVLCASDIIFTAPWLETLIRPLTNGTAAMACPYLSFSDYSAQCYAAPFSRSAFQPCCMTINVNAISRDVWQKTGPLDASYTGNYNDIDYLLRLRARGLSAVVLDCGLITHLGGATLSTSSQLRAEKDRGTFQAKHPRFATADFWHKCWDPLLCRSRTMRLLLRTGRSLTPLQRRPLRVAQLLRLEPFFNRVAVE